MRVLTHGQNNLKIYQDSQFNIHRKIEDYLLIDDIKNDQQDTIGELHYDSIAGYTRTIFTPHFGDKVVVNETLYSSNRINYNLGYTPSRFTATFDYKAGGGDGADGGYFYFHAKGSKNPNDAIICETYDFETGEPIQYACDTFPIGKYSSEDGDAYRIHFDEYLYNQQAAISWNGYQGIGGELIATLGEVYEYPAGFDFADNIWRTIKINFDNGLFRFFVNNIILIEVVDSSYSSRDLTGNNFGLGGYVGGLFNYHYFKNFKFYNILF